MNELKSIFSIHGFQFGYGTLYANTMLNSLGEAGRHAYLFQQIPLDLIFPFLFGVGNCLLLAYLMNKLNSLNPPYIYMCLLPVLASSFDYLENFGILSMLFNYPNLSELLVQTTSMFSVTKSLLTTVIFVVLIVVMIAFTLTRLFSAKRN